SRSAAVTLRVLTQIGRDRRTLGMMVLMPAVIMLIFGFALGGQVSNVPILVDNQDAGFSATVGAASVNLHAGSQVLQALEASGNVKVTTGNFSAGKLGVDSGSYSASILIPPNFSRELYLKSTGVNATPSLQMYLDGTTPTVDAAVMSALQGSIQNASGARVFEIAQQYAFGGAKFSGLDASLPAVIAFVLTFLVLLISLLTIERETTSGTLPRLYTTPLTALERLFGYTVALLFLAILMVSVILAVGVGIFGVVVRGSLLLLFSAAVLYAFAHVLLAVFLSNFAKNELQAVQLAPLIALPSMALGGMLVPVTSLPAWIQPISKVIPLYYGNRLFQGIMLKGYGIGDLTTEFLVVGVMAVLFFILALSTVKDRMDA
ncbi:MAG: ABC transporter permease, partial [Nitrososphaerales archaeon]